jgi:hypothetical protein
MRDPRLAITSAIAAVIGLGRGAQTQTADPPQRPKVTPGTELYGARITLASRSAGPACRPRPGVTLGTAAWRFRLTAVLAAAVAALGAVLAIAASPAAAAPGQPTSHPIPSLPSGVSFDNIAVSQAAVWVFADAGTGAPGSITELSPATGRQIRTLRERAPGQTPWVVAAYGNHPWTTVVPADGVPALAEVSAAGAFTHSVNLAYAFTPEGPVAGAAAPAGSHLWAAAGSPRGEPTGLLEVSATNGARIRFLRWPRALRGFFPQGMAVSGTQIWMTDGECQIARVTISSDQGSIFRLPPRDCQLGSLPAQISATGGYVWVQAYDTTVANDGSVAELNAQNGHLVRLISGRTYGWNFPSFLAAGPYLWVTSQTGGFDGNGSVTELSARTGRLVHFFSARRYHFDQSSAIAAWGSHVWILNLDSVTKL